VGLLCGADDRLGRGAVCPPVRGDVPAVLDFLVVGEEVLDLGQGVRGDVGDVLLGM